MECTANRVRVANKRLLRIILGSSYIMIQDFENFPHHGLSGKKTKANTDVFTEAKIVLLDLHKSIYWSIDHLIKYLELHYKKNPASFNHLSEKKYVKRRCNLRFLIQRYFLWLDGTVIPQGSNGSFWWGQYTTPLAAIDFSLLWASIRKIKLQTWDYHSF